MKQSVINKNKVGFLERLDPWLDAPTSKRVVLTFICAIPSLALALATLAVIPEEFGLLIAQVIPTYFLQMFVTVIIVTITLPIWFAWAFISGVLPLFIIIGWMTGTD